MAGISKSPEGVQALRSLSSTLLQELENINKAHDSLKSSYESVKADVAHESEIEDILEEVRVIQANVCVPIVSLSQNVSKLANRLEAFLNGGLGGSGN